MSDFQIHDVESAPEGSRDTLRTIEDEYGFIFNLARVFASSPQTLNGYMTLAGLLEESSFTPEEQQVILLSVSTENECHYCVGAHTGTAKMAGVDDGVIDALRRGEPIPDPRLEALRSFTQAMVRERGWVPDEAVHAFLDAGFERRQILDVILGIALKTLSNYTNHLAETPLDEAFADFEWSPAGAEPAGVPGA